MIKKLLISTLFAWCGLGLYAQTITTAEYFFDTDPGIGSATSFSVTSGNSISENVSVNVDALSLGFHILGVRVKQGDDQWSQTKTSSFYKFAPVTASSEVVAAEYFFDTDPGLGNATALSITPEASLSGTFTVDVSALGSGFHTLTVRVQDDLGQWSVNHTGRFYSFNLPATSDQIVAAEYFFDDDPGLGEGTSLTFTAGSTLSQSFTVPTEDLTDGFHTLTFRVQNELGVWSTNHTGRFFVFTPNLPSDLVSLEYYFDQDPGIGLGQQLPLEAMGSVDSAFVVSVPDTLAEGTHTLFVRAKDANGIYSFQESRTFEVITDPIIDDFFPKEGGPGTQVSIIGSNFSAVSGENTVKFGEAFATNVVFASTDSLVVVVPTDASGIVPIEVNVGEKIGVSEELYNVDVAAAEGLIAYYPFNGNANDESGNGNDGTVNGATLTIDRFGEVSSAYSFDGVDDEISALPIDMVKEFTITAWINVGNLPSSSIGYTIVEQSLSSGNATFGMDISDTESISVFFRNPSQTLLSFNSNSPINKDNWVFVAGLYDSNFLKIFTNGGLNSDLEVGEFNVLQGATRLGIGDDGVGSNNPFNGLIDDVRIYNRALKPEEILELSADRPQEAPAIANQSFNIAENRIAGTALGTIEASDVNNDPLSFEILSGNTGNTFTLVDSTGVLLVNDPEALDFEVNPSFTLEVGVSDGIATSQAIITISVTDVDESGNQLPQLLAETFVVKENRINGLFIARLTAGDPDGDALTFSILSGNIGNAFLIDQDGNLITNNEDALDFEVNPQFDLLVRVSDGQVDVDETITIVLQDVDESVNQAPQANNASFSILENAANGSSVGTLLAGDPDGDDLTFNIISGNTAGTFAISTTGQLSVVDSTLLDFETNPQFNLEVTISDGALTIARDVVVNLQDVVENVAPVVANPIADQTLNEGFATSTIALAGVFSDADEDELTFTVSSSDEMVVTVSESGGTLTITEIGLGSATVSVTADDGNGGTVTDEFEVTVEAAPNNAPVVANPIEDQTLTQGFGTLEINLSQVFSDADADDLSFSASVGNQNIVAVAVGGTTLTLTEQGLGTVEVTVTATDGNGGSVSDVFSVTVEEDQLLSAVNSDELSGLKAYPNPTNADLTVSFGDIPAGKYRVVLRSVLGSESTLLYEGQLRGGESQTFSVADRLTGMYLLTITVEETELVKRIIIE